MSEYEFPLHPAQQDVYLDQLLNTDSPQYNIGGYIVLNGDLDKAKFHEAVNSVPEVFDSFKMRFDAGEGDLLCHYESEYAEAALNELDFSGRTAPGGEAVDWMQSRFNTAFVLKKGRLPFEQYLIKISESEHWFFGRYHHLITDGYGFIVYVQYVSRKYSALVSGEEVSFSYPSYREASLAANDYYHSAGYQEDGNYWKEKIPVIPEKLLSKRYTNIAGKTGTTYNIDLGEAQRARLEELQVSSKTGLQQLTIAALLIYFGKLSSSTEFIFGTPIHKRGSRQLRNTVGMFSGILPFKGHYNKEQTLADLLKEISATQRSDYRHQNYLIGDLSRHLKINTSEGYLTEVQVNYEPLDFELDFGNAIAATITRLANEDEQNPLQLCWRDYGKKQALQLQVQFCFAYFSQEEIELLAKRIFFILEQFSNALDQQVGTIATLPQKEREELLHTFNDTKSTYPEDKTVISLFEEQAKTTPDATAITFEGEQISYKTLNERSNQAANYLRGKGVKREMLVPICIERGIDMVTGILGILKAGGTYVPVDPDYPQDRIAYMLEDSKARIIVSSQKSRQKLQESKATIIELDGDREKISREPVASPNEQPSPRDLAYVIYTSGSTGKPKGVMIEHRSVVNLLTSIAKEVNFTQDSTFLSVTTYSFDICYLELYMPLITGASLVIVSRETASDGYQLAKSLEEHLPTHMQGTPSTWQLLADAGWENREQVKMLIGGEAVKEGIKDYLTQRGEVWNVYGPTETTIWSAIKKLAPTEKVNIGKPIANTQIYILTENKELCPIGVTGEICIGGAGLARGYYNRNELTQEKFIPNPFSHEENARLYKTGDLGRWLTDGNIEYQGRKDDQVKIRGYRIELGEIESILNQNEQVQQAVVLAKEDQQGNKRLVGYVVPKGTFDKQAIQAHLNTKLPEYMVPAIWVELENLPLTANGKIDRKALPDPDISQITTEYIAPENDTERALVNIWQELLNLEKIGTSDNFFELGGHSLSAMRVVSAIRKQLNIEITIRDLFAHPTIGNLGTHLDQQVKGTMLPAITAGERPEYIPLSFSQERLWFIDHSEGSVQYHLPAVLRLKGNLDRKVLEETLRTVISRHEVLRTVIREHGDRGTQHILGAEGWDLTITEGIPTAEPALSDYIEGLISKPFNLSEDYMLRAELIRLDEREHMLVVTMHHIASDNWSVSILVKEVVTLYEAYGSDGEPRLPQLPVQYADYAIWQRKNIQGELLSAKLDYWKAKLEGTAALELPADHSRPAVRSYHGATRSFSTGRELRERLLKLSHEQGATLYMTMLATFKVLLYRYSGQEDICVGTPVAGRDQAETEGLIGFFVNTLALRSHIKGDMPFRKLLEEVRETTMEAYANQEAPFEKVVDAVVKVRDRSRSPLFQVVFTFFNTPEIPELQLGGLSLTAENRQTTTTPFDIILYISETSAGITGTFEYSTDLYRAGTIERMAGHYINLLESIAARPENAVGQIPMLGETEQARLLSTFNHTETVYPKENSIVDLFEDQVGKQPKAIALEFEDEKISYAELNKRANRLARYLQKQGIKPEMLVPICVERGPDMIAGILGILKAGGAYVPIDPEYPHERITYMLEDTGATIIISNKANREKLGHSSALIIELDSDRDLISIEDTANIENKPSEKQLGYVIYTSGSTGKPKGVMIEHGGVVNLATSQAKALRLMPEIKTLQFASFGFDASCYEIFNTLLSGGNLVLCSKEDLLSAQRFKELVQKHRVSVAVLPASFQLTLDDDTLDILRTIVSAGEPLNETTGRHIQSRGVRLINAYGPTETTVCASLSDDPIRTGGVITIGGPIANMRICMLDENGGLCPVGIKGELCVGGPGLARGYLNLPELTKEKFIRDPFSSDREERLYKTGDLARWLPDGNIEYLGRRDDQVKIRGYRIELGEIESVLNQSGLVSQGVVLAKEDSSGNKRLIGYAVAADTFDKQEIQSYLSARLPEYMVPALWVELESLPITTSGKIDRKALPDPESVEVSKSYAAPRNETETALAEIWQELLDLDHIGIFDNFFELGGDSILMIQVLSRMRRLGYEIPKDIFNYQDITGLSEAIGRGTEQAGSGEQGELSGSFGLMPIQEWYLESAGKDISHYNQGVLLKIRKTVSAAALREALDQLRARHDSLGLVFKKEGGNWQQEYGTEKLQLEEEHLERTDKENLSKEINTKAETCQRSLSIEEGILARAVLMHTPAWENDNRLLIVIHHLAVDGVSWRILLSDLEQLLDGQVSGRQITLGAKGASYRQWRQALEQYSQTRRLGAQTAYWEQVVKSYEPLPEEKHNTGAVQVKDLQDCHVKLNTEETRYLLQEVPKVYHTEISDLLLGALCATLCKWSGNSNITVGLEAHGREAISQETESSGTVGWFTSLYPVMLRNAPDSGTLIKETKEILRQVPDKGLGYGVLKYISKTGQLQGKDPWDVVFNYLGQLDTAIGQGKWLSVAEESSGSDISGEQAAAAKLSVNSSVYGGELALRWSYSSKQYHQETISKIAADYITQLKQLITHCREQKEPVYTPSDYGLGAEVTNAELDHFLEASEGGKPRKDQIEGLYRLSGLQQGMLFHGLYDNSGSYMQQFGCDLRGADKAALLSSWSEVIRRHSILRSAFYHDAFSIPVQCVYREVKIPVEEQDYRNMDENAKRSALKAYEAADRAKGFDFRSAPLMRLALIRLADDRYRMLWTSHHILFDGWSFPIMIGEFLNAYEHLLKGKTLAITAQDKYEDYVRYLERRDKEAEEQYWRNYLSGISHGTLLPFVRNTAERTKGRGQFGSLTLKLDGTKAARIQSYAQSQRLTVNTLMQGVWALLLQKYTGEQTVVYGVVVSGRPAELAGVEQRVGMYINTLALKASAEPQQETVGWLQELQAEQVTSRNYQYTPLQDVQGWTGIKGDLFDSLLIFENYPVSKLIESGSWSLHAEHIEVSEQTNYPLTVSIIIGEELSAEFSYNAELMDEAYVTAIMDQFEQVLLQIARGSAKTIGDIRVLTASQEEQLLNGFNSTATIYPKDKSIVDLFEAQVAKTPEATAVVFEEQHVTYKELNERSNQLARYLIRKGVKAETLVPICIERGQEMITAILGILKAGGAYVPIDPDYPQERIAYMLEDTGASLIVSSLGSRGKLPDSNAVIVEIDGDREQISQEEGANPQVMISPEQLAYVIYTSGSTGRPKGVMIEHGSLVSYLCNNKTGYITGDETKAGSFIHLSYTFDASLTSMFMPLLKGKYVVIGSKQSAEVFTDGNLEKYAPYDFIKITPSHLALLPPTFRSSNGSWLTQKLVIGGEALRLSQLESLITEGVKAEIINEYGPTEATVGCSTYSFHTQGEHKFTGNEVPIGKPISNTHIYILDAEGQLSPVGVTGEICIGGPGLARGYLNRPEQTAERFIEDPFNKEGGRLYRTGDLGRWQPDGNIDYMGRRDDQVKIRGYRIELGEIESVLNTSELVSQGVVLAKEDKQGNKRLVGYLVPEDKFDQQSIQNYLSIRLPEYMVPGIWVKLESLPLTTNGKVDRKALPDPEMNAITAEYVAPRNETEAALVQIWQQLLQMERIGVNDNFFELGGHSILVMRAVAAIRKELSVSIPVDMLFQFTSISGLSKYLEIQASGSLQEENTDEFDIVNI